MDIRIRAKVEGFSVWIEPEEISHPEDAARQFEDLVRQATRRIISDQTAGSSSSILVATGELRPQEIGSKPASTHPRPLVPCPHCDSPAKKGAGLAAHIRREHAWSFQQGG